MESESGYKEKTLPIRKRSTAMWFYSFLLCLVFIRMSYSSGYSKDFQGKSSYKKKGNYSSSFSEHTYNSNDKTPKYGGSFHNPLSIYRNASSSGPVEPAPQRVKRYKEKKKLIHNRSHGTVTPLNKEQNNTLPPINPTPRKSSRINSRAKSIVNLRNPYNSNKKTRSLSTKTRRNPSISVSKFVPNRGPYNSNRNYPKGPSDDKGPPPKIRDNYLNYSNRIRRNVRGQKHGKTASSVMGQADNTEKSSLQDQEESWFNLQTTKDEKEAPSKITGRGNIIKNQKTINIGTGGGSLKSPYISSGSNLSLTKKKLKEEGGQDSGNNSSNSSSSSFRKGVKKISAIQHIPRVKFIPFPSKKEDNLSPEKNNFFRAKKDHFSNSKSTMTTDNENLTNKARDFEEELYGMKDFKGQNHEDYLKRSHRGPNSCFLLTWITSLTEWDEDKAIKIITENLRKDKVVQEKIVRDNGKLLIPLNIGGELGFIEQTKESVTLFVEDGSNTEDIKKFARRFVEKINKNNFRQSQEALSLQIALVKSNGPDDSTPMINKMHEIADQRGSSGHLASIQPRSRNNRASHHPASIYPKDDRKGHSDHPIPKSRKPRKYIESLKSASDQNNAPSKSYLEEPNEGASKLEAKKKVAKSKLKDYNLKRKRGKGQKNKQEGGSNKTFEREFSKKNSSDNDLINYVVGSDSDDQENISRWVQQIQEPHALTAFYEGYEVMNSLKNKLSDKMDFSDLNFDVTMVDGRRKYETGEEKSINVEGIYEGQVSSNGFRLGLIPFTKLPTIEKNGESDSYISSDPMTHLFSSEDEGPVYRFFNENPNDDARLLIPINLGNNHWNSLEIEREGGQYRFKVFDPVGGNPNKNVYSYIGKKLEEGLGISEDDITYSYNPIKHQNSNSNCGPFTIAHIVARLEGQNLPNGFGEDQANMIRYSDMANRVVRYKEPKEFIESKDEIPENPKAPISPEQSFYNRLKGFKQLSDRLNSETEEETFSIEDYNLLKSAKSILLNKKTLKILEENITDKRERDKVYDKNEERQSKWDDCLDLLKTLKKQKFVQNDDQFKQNEEKILRQISYKEDPKTFLAQESSPDEDPLDLNTIIPDHSRELKDLETMVQNLPKRKEFPDEENVERQRQELKHYERKKEDNLLIQGFTDFYQGSQQIPVLPNDESPNDYEHDEDLEERAKKLSLQTPSNKVNKDAEKSQKNLTDRDVVFENRSKDLGCSNPCHVLTWVNPPEDKDDITAIETTIKALEEDKFILKDIFKNDGKLLIPLNIKGEIGYIEQTKEEVTLFTKTAHKNENIKVFTKNFTKKMNKKIEEGDFSTNSDERKHYNRPNAIFKNDSPYELDRAVSEMYQAASLIPPAPRKPRLKEPLEDVESTLGKEEDEKEAPLKTTATEVTNRSRNVKSLDTRIKGESDGTNSKDPHDKEKKKEEDSSDKKSYSSLRKLTTKLKLQNKPKKNKEIKLKKSSNKIFQKGVRRMGAFQKPTVNFIKFPPIGESESSLGKNKLSDAKDNYFAKKNKVTSDKKKFTERDIKFKKQIYSFKNFKGKKHEDDLKSRGGPNPSFVLKWSIPLDDWDDEKAIETMVKALNDDPIVRDGIFNKNGKLLIPLDIKGERGFIEQTKESVTLFVENKSKKGGTKEFADRFVEKINDSDLYKRPVSPPKTVFFTNDRPDDDPNPMIREMYQAADRRGSSSHLASKQSGFENPSGNMERIPDKEKKKKTNRINYSRNITRLYASDRMNPENPDDKEKKKERDSSNKGRQLSLRKKLTKSKKIKEKISLESIPEETYSKKISKISDNQNPTNRDIEFEDRSDDLNCSKPCFVLKWVKPLQDLNFDETKVIKTMVKALEEDPDVLDAIFQNDGKLLIPLHIGDERGFIEQTKNNVRLFVREKLEETTIKKLTNGLTKAISKKISNKYSRPEIVTFDKNSLGYNPNQTEDKMYQVANQEESSSRLAIESPSKKKTNRSNYSRNITNLYTPDRMNPENPDGKEKKKERDSSNKGRQPNRDIEFEDQSKNLDCLNPCHVLKWAKPPKSWDDEEAIETMIKALNDNPIVRDGILKDNGTLLIPLDIDGRRMGFIEQTKNKVTLFREDIYERDARKFTKLFREKILASNPSEYRASLGKIFTLTNNSPDDGSTPTIKEMYQAGKERESYLASEQPREKSKRPIRTAREEGRKSGNDRSDNADGSARVPMMMIDFEEKQQFLDY